MVHDGSTVAAVGALAWHFPPLREVLREHMTDNDGGVLPHVVMSDYERWAEGLVDHDRLQLQQFLDFLDGLLDAA
jgi:hypothetical protein